TLYRGDGATAVVGAVPGGTPAIPYFAGQTVGLGLYISPEVPTTGTVVQVINGQQVGSYQISLLPTTGYVGATVRNAANPITATIKSFIFHPTVRKKRFVYVNASGSGSLG